MEVTFDPAKVTYDELLNSFWNMHDPTTLNRQGPDHGPQYRSAIFFHSSEQEASARKSAEQAQRYFDKHPGHASCHWIRGWVPEEAASNA